jgi:hypothetical protein
MTKQKEELASVFRPLVDKLLQSGEVVPGGVIEGEIKAMALKRAADLRKHWRLCVTAEQSDTAIANKICRKFGLTLERLRRISGGISPSGKKTWVWIYSIQVSPHSWRWVLGVSSSA